MQIRENDPALLEDFIALNEAWIKQHFAIEAADRALAAHPYSVIEEGGYIFSILSDDLTVLGVCALFNKGAGEFELARMAVAEEARGLGYGSILIDTCLSKLKSINASKVYLVSNIKLEPAINLYKKHGFKTTSLGQHPVYARANIVMEAKLTSDEESS